MTSFRRFVPLLFLLALAAFVATTPAFAQATLASTTLGAAVSATDQCVSVASASGITAPGGLNNFTTYLYVDREELPVTSVSGTYICVRRGGDSTPVQTHNSGATVWVGPPNYFRTGTPGGSCTATSEVVLPRIVVDTGEVWTCPSSGTQSGQWYRQGTSSPFVFTDGSFFIPASSCVSSVSGNGDTTQGLTTVGASVVPVMYASTTASGTNKHTYICTIHVPDRLTTGKGIQITSATFLYGVQTTGLGTQATTLASGTFNSSTVFSKITFPAAGASETPSTVTPVRADSGTMVITPVAASSNVATTTAGAFYSINFAPATPIAMTTDLTELLLTVTLQAAATSATVTNTPGVIVYYTAIPL